jgi:outer membrane protein OmpA-like peptidoglycan-associated protein
MMDSILGMVTPNMQQALASRLGESPQAVQNGLGAATAATLSGLAGKAGDSGFLSQITGLLSGGTGQTLLADLPSLASGSPSGAVTDVVNKFLPMIFGSQQNQVTNGIAHYAGLSPGSGLGLLKMAIPLVFAYFAKLHSAGPLTTSSLGSMLRAEAPNLQSYLPSGLFGSSAPGAVGPGTAGSAASRTEADVRYGVTAAPPPRSRWLIPVAILGALLLAWWLIRSLSPPKQPVQTAANTTCQGASTAASTVSNTALGDMMRVSLPNGEQLIVPTLGVERKLVTYFNSNPNSAGGPASGPTWFVFDRLRFDTGQATLQPASQEQLGCVAEILRVYPQVKVVVDGYTDNTGDPAANLQLSQQRADSVMAQLVVLGVDPSRMTAKGYGQDNPVADNSTEEGRQENRRIALEVVPANPP